MEVVAAQPSDEFGTAAIQALRAAKFAPGDGATGCVEVIRFRIADAGADAAEPDVEMPKVD